MAQLCVRSLRRFFDGRVDVITDGRVTGATVTSVPSMNSRRAAAIRLRLPEILGLDPGESVLYLDADVLALKPLDLPAPRDRVMVYGYPQRTQRDPSFAGRLTTDPAVVRQRAFCSGILYFRATDSIRAAFRAALDGYTSALRAGKRLPC
jgi:hypothetical protein